MRITESQLRKIVKEALSGADAELENHEVMVKMAELRNSTYNAFHTLLRAGVSSDEAKSFLQLTVEVELDNVEKPQ